MDDEDQTIALETFIRRSSDLLGAKGWQDAPSKITHHLLTPLVEVEGGVKWLNENSSRVATWVRRASAAAREEFRGAALRARASIGDEAGAKALDELLHGAGAS
jgi:hypothetical protein